MKPTILSDETQPEPEPKPEPTRRSVSISIENWRAVDAIAKRERRGIGDQLDMILEKTLAEKASA